MFEISEVRRREHMGKNLFMEKLMNLIELLRVNRIKVFSLWRLKFGGEI